MGLDNEYLEPGYSKPNDSDSDIITTLDSSESLVSPIVDTFPLATRDSEKPSIRHFPMQNPAGGTYGRRITFTLINVEFTSWRVTTLLSKSAFLPPFLSIPEMPPKNPRGAKAGAILSGISRAGPGEADIGSMVPQDASNLSRNHGELLQCLSATSSNMLGIYCHMCCDAIQPGFQHQCINCHALICEHVQQEGIPVPYLCKDWKQEGFSFAVRVFWLWEAKKVKMEWPMCLVNLNVESLEEGYLVTTTKVELINHYKSQTSNVHGADILFLFIHTLPITQAVHTSEPKNLADGIELIHKAIKAGCPPNSFVMIDNDLNEIAEGSTLISDVVAKSLGEEFMECMGAASSAASGDTIVNITATGKKPWCDLTAKARGGRRALLLVGSHPSIRLRHNFESLVSLVENDKFDFVLGFGGSGTSASQISHTCPRQIECRQIGKDAPALRAFGYEFKTYHCACQPQVDLPTFTAFMTLHC
ncbi:uncharacterized protein HD556DRAFT_1314462 [Suillus plorans]|uniref:Uncharacterized protein n=1 Tax=Suillus plorans TaxID=116603 RepID=A0A9P7ABV6_9AGAM|nr:uncharacterized protein HD556DRAFT_1314462 [Suillus plorans]KAG1785201.1 hypothetical protein HD556DRAFT_1314462 [Suillus plorans]